MGTWIQRAPMPTPRHDLQSIAVDGTIYAISGADDLTVDAVEIYDVASDTWTQGPAHSHQAGMAGRRPHRPQDLRGRRQNHPHA